MSNKSEKKPEILSSVMDSINNEEVRMKSKWFFLALSSLTFVSTCLVAITLSIILTTVWNDIDVARTAQVLEFGSPGRAFMLRNAPWILLVAAAVLVATLYYLVSKSEVSYKKQYSAPMLVLAGIVVSGIVLSVGGLNQKLADATLKDFRTIESALDKQYVEGKVIRVGDNSVKVESKEGSYDVKLPADRIRRRLPNLFKEGQEVKIFGKYVDDEFEAYGIIPSDFDLRERRVKGIRKDF